MSDAPDDLTETQWSVLLYMVGFLEREHRMPVYAEIAEHFEWSSPNSALTHVRTLEARGYLNRAGRHLRFTRHVVKVAPRHVAELVPPRRYCTHEQ